MRAGQGLRPSIPESNQMLKVSAISGEVSPSRVPHPADLVADDTGGLQLSDQERWLRVKKRLRTEVGDDIFSSWFARMDLEGVEDETVRFSVPTRFLKSWIQAHYIERVLACWQAEQFSIRRVELLVRSAVLRTPAAK